MPDVSNSTDVSPRPLAVAWANSSRKRRKEIDHKDNSGSSRNEGEVQVGKGATDEGRRTPKPPTSLAFSEKLLLT